MNKKRKIFVAGAEGFLGRVLTARLKKSGFNGVRRGTHAQYDFTILSDCLRAVRGCATVINAAGIVTSRRDQVMRPAEILYANVLIHLQLLEAAARAHVKEFIEINSIAAYPRSEANRLAEDILFGERAPRLEGPLGYYGFSKWIGFSTTRVFSLQYGVKTRILIFPNLYGPFDKFNHAFPPLVPNLIKGLSDAVRSQSSSFHAGANPNAGIDLLYVDDAAEAIVRVLKNFGEEDFSAYNAGSGTSLTVRKVCQAVARSVRFEGALLWENEEGTPTKLLDFSSIKKRYGWKPRVSFMQGIEKTVRNWKR